MAKKGTFTYAGRKDEPTGKFMSGECAMETTSSGSYANIKANAKFEFGVAALPYYPSVKGAPQNTIIGGATLWVMTQKDPAVYKGIAALLHLPVVARRSSSTGTSRPATCRSRSRPTSWRRRRASTRSAPASTSRSRS